MHVARTVYDALLAGDAITDDDLEESLYFFRKLSEDLRILGQVFHLAANEAERAYLQLYGFWAERKHDSIAGFAQKIGEHKVVQTAASGT